MTPDEKAKELYDKYRPFAQAYFDMETGWDLKEEKENTKKIITMVAEEIQKSPLIGYSNSNDASQYDYWQAVKEAISNL